MFLIKHTPETKAEPIGDQPTETKKFDVVGLIILVVSMLSINVIITQTSQFGLFTIYFGTYCNFCYIVNYIRDLRK